MEDLIETVTRGNPTEIKVILASVALALAVYQLVLISVAYGKVKLPFLGAPPASQAHRAVGDSIVVVLVVVAVMCVGYFGFEDGATLHVVAAIAVVTAKFGPTSAAEQEAVEEPLEQREERLEERQELLEERREER